LKTWIAFSNILIKDMRSYYLKPPNISWGLIFPIAWTLMFFLRSPVAVEVRDLLPGVMALSILFGTTSMLAVTITFERKAVLSKGFCWLQSALIYSCWLKPPERLCLE